MTTLREAAQQALEVLVRASSYYDTYAEIAALEAALAEPVQEPVATNIGCLGMPVNTPVTPPQRKPLTEEKPWRCACGANLYIDENGAPRSKA